MHMATDIPRTATRRGGHTEADKTAGKRRVAPDSQARFQEKMSQLKQQAMDQERALLAARKQETLRTLVEQMSQTKWNQDNRVNLSSERDDVIKRQARTAAHETEHVTESTNHQDAILQQIAEITKLHVSRLDNGGSRIDMDLSELVPATQITITKTDNHYSIRFNTGSGDAFNTLTANEQQLVNELNATASNGVTFDVSIDQTTVHQPS